MSYFLIECSEDGDVSITQHDRESLVKSISNGEYKNATFINSVPGVDPQYWGGQVLVIKGEIVVPKPKEVVMEYDI
jgi:hypothetical protein